MKNQREGTGSAVLFPVFPRRNSENPFERMGKCKRVFISHAFRDPTDPHIAGAQQLGGCLHPEL